MIELVSVVSLAPQTRLRFDRHSQRHMLLYPERGLLLSASAADVLAQCGEARAVGAIVAQLVEKYGSGTREAIEQDVLCLLRGLAERGLVRVLPP